MTSGAAGRSIRLSINGRDVTGRANDTILQVCKANEIHVPTLCHLERLPDVGACRLCIVEIEGARRPAPACATPASEGMRITTDTPTLESLRRQTLELLFGERNHICPFCPRSGNCELQSRAYQHGMDHVRYDYLFPKLPVDNSHRYITLDHNRCILCSRCVRACDQWVGAHTLDIDERGNRCMITADMGAPLGASSCVSCGTCVTVCPTGALFEKRSAHWQGRPPQAYQETICTGCGVGCRMEASVRFGQIGELRSAGGPAANQVLCEKGRFWMVNPRYPRVTEVRVRKARQFVPAPLDGVLDECARRLRSPQIQNDANRVVALISGHLPLETIHVVQSFMRDVVGSNRWAIADRSNSQSTRAALQLDAGLPPLATLDELEQADLFLLLGANLERNAGVAASYVRRGVLHRRARLLAIDPKHTWLTDWTDVSIDSERRRDSMILAAMLKYLLDLGVADRARVPAALAERIGKLDDDAIAVACGVDAARIKRMAELYAEAKSPVVICGRGISKHGPDGLIAALNLVRATGARSANGRWRLMELALQANSAGGRLFGRSELNMYAFDPHTADLAFVVIGDSQRPWPKEWIEKLRTVTYVVALLAREREEALAAAHVLIPTASWAERGGTYVNLEGRLQTGVRLIDPGASVVDEAAFFDKLAARARVDGPSWSPQPLPDACAGVADGGLLPCRSDDDAVVDWTTLEMLAEA